MQPAPVPPAPVPPAPPVPLAAPPAVRPWSPWAEARRDWAWAALLVGVLAVAGVLVGLLWWGIAPRAQFAITSSGPQVIGDPSDELLAADDSVFALLLGGLGLLAGLGTWLVRRRRGLAALLGVALGTLVAGVVAWRLGELLGPPPTKAELGHLGAHVTTALHLAALPALAVGPFAAVLVYLLGSLWNRSDDLGRRSAGAPGADGDAPAAAEDLPVS